MEVHPPEHAIHTKREFFIHMFAIILGLLIAIGLEQTVEAIHHHHQRNELEEEVRQEAELNVQILKTHLDVNIPALVQFRADLDAVRAAVPHAGFVDVTLPPPQMPEDRRPMQPPERTVWPVSESSGSIALLPEPQAQVYARLDFDAVEDAKQVDLIRAASGLLTRFTLATGYQVRPNETMHLSLAQRDQLISALSTQVQQLFDLLRRDNFYMLDAQGLLLGFDNVKALLDWQAAQPTRINDYLYTIRGK